MKIQRNVFSRRDVNGVDVLLTDAPEVKVAIKKHKKTVKNLVVWSIVGTLLFVLILNVIILPLTGGCARVEHIEKYTGNNRYITFSSEYGLLLSAHRAGGVLEPEETMAAFKQCMEQAKNENYKVDILEFDLHLTKDDVLVLMHDHEIDRTSNGTGKICDMTLAELKTYNFGYNFKTTDGVYKYRDKDGDDLKDVRIATLEEVLTYVENDACEGKKTMQYVIEIKDGGEVGKRAMNKLYRMMDKFDIIDRTVFGTFQGEISKYVDECNANGAFEKEVVRSAGIAEVLDFYYAFLYGNTNAKFNFKVLQIPMGFNGFFDLSTKEFIDFAHSLDIAVQYWTINDPDDVAKLQANGADCIMTDDPKMAYNALNRVERIECQG